jgi:hypothetical protein
MQVWIGEIIEQDLNRALQRRDKNESWITGKVDNLVIEDNGSTLNVKSSTPRIVQLIKVALLLSVLPNFC